MTGHAELLAIAERAMDLAREMFTSRAPGALTEKTERDFASELDYAIERELRRYLRQATPDIGFLSEEEGAVDVDPDQAFWALDPVDGTANLVHGIPLCGSSLGLVQAGRPTLGVIDLPFLGHRYTARAGHGAYRDGRRLQASTVTKLDSAVISTGDYAVGPDAAKKNNRRFAIARELAARAERVRMLGSAAIDLAWVAAGQLDGSIMLANKPWDVTAGIIIAREAGAHVLDIDGTDHTLDATATISAAPGIVNAVRDLLAHPSINDLDSDRGATLLPS